MEAKLNNNKSRSTGQYWRNKGKKIKRVNIDIPENLWDLVGEKAIMQGTQKREIVIQALSEYLGVR